MLSLLRKLYFPKLVRDSTKKSMYSLEWVEQELRAAAISGLVAIGEKGLPLATQITSLPEPYDRTIKDLVFTLSQPVIVELRRYCQMALMELNFHKRLYGEEGNYLTPSCAYVESAFRLLADAIYDEATEQFTRDYALKAIAFHGMLYKFWCFQSYRGSAIANAGIYRLAGAMKYARMPHDVMSEEELGIANFLRALQEHQQQIHELLTKQKENDQ